MQMVVLGKTKSDLRVCGHISVPLSIPVVLSLCVGPVSGAPTEVVQPSDGRASLLESIRNAGGIGKAKLRDVKERKMEKKKQKEQEQGGDVVLLHTAGNNEQSSLWPLLVFIHLIV